MQAQASEVVNDFKNLLKKELEPNIYKLWISPLIMHFEDEKLNILAPNLMHQYEIENRLLDVFQKNLTKLSKQKIELEIGIKKQELNVMDLSILKKPQNSSPESSNETLVSELNDLFTFEEFVVGPDNQMAQASCLAVAREPSCQYNPLFLYGNTGLGKTHLLQAIYHYISTHHPHLKIVYTNCESFTNRFIEAINQHTLDLFRRLYRLVDVLIVDDIQFLADKRSTQEEFFHTFNDLILAQKQVIVSSDSAPKELQKFEHRLTTRFSSGLVACIDKPIYETRLAIIRHKCDQLNLNLTEEIKQTLAKMNINNIRELNGTLITLNAHSKFNNQTIDSDFIRSLFPQYNEIFQNENLPINYDDVINIVTAHFNIRLQDLQSKKRPKSIAFPRQVSMYLLRKLTHHSLEEVGAFFGGRDHSTVQYAQTKIEKERNKNSELDSLLSHLEEAVTKLPKK